MTAHHRGFAAAVAGRADPGRWRPLPLGSRPREEYADAARDVAEREVPVGPSRKRPGASFAPPRRLDGNDPTVLDRLLAVLGRSLDRTPPPRGNG